MSMIPRNFEQMTCAYAEHTNSACKQSASNLYDGKAVLSFMDGCRAISSMQMHIRPSPLHPLSAFVFSLALLVNLPFPFSIHQFASRILPSSQICSMILRGCHHARVVHSSPFAVEPSAHFRAANPLQISYTIPSAPSSSDH